MLQKPIVEMISATFAPGLFQSRIFLILSREAGKEYFLYSFSH
jgi:hypothetical protein